jgi:hypothetical protein
LRELLRKAPDLTPAGDRRLIIQEHAVRVAALPAAQRDGDYLAAFGIVAEARRIRHADEFVFDDRLVNLERLRHERA